MKFFSIAIKLLAGFMCTAVLSCADTPRDNPNDPKAGNYKMTGVNVNPSHESVLQADSTVVIIFTDRMDVQSLILGGDLMNGKIPPYTTIAWSSTSITNDTLTISPPDGFWAVGTEKTLTVKCSPLVGKPVSLDLSYTVNLSISAQVTPASGGILDPAENVRIIYSRSMNPASLQITGNAGDSTLILDNAGNADVSWSTTVIANDTLTLAPEYTIWERGTGRSLHIYCESALSASINITRDLTYDVSYTVPLTAILPADGSTIAGHEPVRIQFGESMNPSFIQVSGTIDSSPGSTGAAWSKTVYDNDTVTITPSDSIWENGAGKTLSVECESSLGATKPRRTVNILYGVEYAVYVSTAIDATNPGSPSNQGTMRSPLSIISDAIAKANTIYAAGEGMPAKVCVAHGDYYVNWYSNTNRIVMVEGISLYGGYSSTFNEHNPLLYISSITDLSNAGGVGWPSSNRTVDFTDPLITNATVIDGFTIYGGGSNSDGYAAGIICFDGAKPTIKNNIIRGGDKENSRTYGIINTSSPVIQSNSIFGGKGKVAAGGNKGNSFGIYNEYQTGVTCSPEISDNIIDGGSGYNSYGIYFYNSYNVLILRNNINAGSGDQNTYGIVFYSIYSINIINNLVYGGTGKYETYGIYCQNSSPKIFNNTIDGGYSSASNPNNLFGIYIEDSASSPLIKNNIIFTSDDSFSPSKRFGVYENAVSIILELKNNNIYSCAGALYFDKETGVKTTISSVNSLGTGYSDNISIPTTFNYYNNTILWKNANLHLTSGTDINIRQGGLDGSPSGLNWGFANDMDLNNRTGNNTTGWSIGAYEYD